MIIKYNGQTFDCAHNTWKVFLILDKLKKPTTPQDLMANMLLEIGLGSQSTNQELGTLIANFEKDVYQRIEELKKIKLIYGTTHLSINHKNAKILSQLNIKLDGQLSDAMSVISIIIPSDKYSHGVFSDHNESFITLYNALGYVQRGIFLKISVGKKIYTCIVEVKQHLAELYDKIARLQYSLNRIGVRLLALERIPLKPIMLFPFFVVAPDVVNASIKEWKKKQFVFTQEEAKSYMANWFKDYLKFSLQTSQNVKNYSLADPHYDKPKEIVAFLDTKLTGLTTFYYISDTESKINLQLVEHAPSLESIPKGNQYPSRDKLIHCRGLYAQDLFTTLGHPKIAAIQNIGTKIQELNKKAKAGMFDTNIVTKSNFKKWIKMQIDATRKLIEYFQISDYYWNCWKKPILVYATYKLHEQQPSWRRSGHYSIHYKNSERDEIFVQELINDQKSSDVFKETANRNEFFSSSTGDLLTYLMEIKGEYFRSYF